MTLEDEQQHLAIQSYLAGSTRVLRLNQQG